MAVIVSAMFGIGYLILVFIDTDSRAGWLCATAMAFCWCLAEIQRTTS